MSIPLLPHNPDWFRQADLLIDDLGHLLGARALRLDHVGSTAVPGLIAKPKLHIDVTLAPGFSPAALSNDLLLYGYHDLGARFREDEVQMTRPAGPGPRTKKRENQELIIAHRLCLCASDCPSPAQRRQFRDALRGDASLAGRYAALKRDLTLKAGSTPDWETYNSGKTSFIEGVLSGEGMRLIQQ